jgi:hypothetical protein
LRKLNFAAEFEKALERHNLSYDVKGVVTGGGQVYPLGTDTKVLSSVFELLARPLIYEVAKQHGLEVREARAQNYYPDFTLMSDERDKEKIAVDVKTTYRDKEEGWLARFTLGSYTSFLRPTTEAKNIEFPYSEYAKHWIVGFIYRRVNSVREAAHIYPLASLDQIQTPLSGVAVFAQEKWRIAGDRAGSGNTTNIGSIAGGIDDFRRGRSIFSSEAEFLAYWRNYGRTAAHREGAFTNIEEFRRWMKKKARKSAS